MTYQIVEINQKNISTFPSMCFSKNDNVGFKLKSEWIKKRVKDGLKIKALVDEKGNKMNGYIEYIDGEKAFRAVDASGYLFVHCLWITPNKLKKKGYGSDLIQECEKEAKGKLGIAAVVSDGSFMASQEIFVKNGFEVVAEDGKEQLVVKQFKKGSLPKFRDYAKQLKKYQGWHIVYSNQCPWVARFVDELDAKVIKELDLKITEIKTPKQAQNAPSIYSTFNLIKDGKILADRYISNTRFKNILAKNR